MEVLFKMAALVSHVSLVLSSISIRPIVKAFENVSI